MHWLDKEFEALDVKLDDTMMQFEYRLELMVYKLATDYRWYSHGSLGWDDYQARCRKESQDFKRKSEALRNRHVANIRAGRIRSGPPPLS